MHQLCDRPLPVPSGTVQPIRLGLEYSSLDEVELARMRHLLRRVVDQSTAPVVALDFSGTLSFGAAFLGLLVETSLRLQRQQRRLLLRGLSSEQERLLRLTKTNSLLAVDRNGQWHAQAGRRC